MRLGKTYEKELPKGYEAVYTVDAKNKKTALILTLSSLLMAAVIVLTAFFIIRPTDAKEGLSYVKLTFFILTLVAYLVFHELTHGLAYKILTGEKLTFGLTLSVAYCGVPNIFVYRKAALVALLSPFVIFTLFFGASFFIFTNEWNLFLAVIVFAVHFSGCVGDLYGAYLYIFKFRDNTTLMQDTGPKQTFYQKVEKAE